MKTIFRTRLAIGLLSAFLLVSLLQARELGQLQEDVRQFEGQMVTMRENQKRIRLLAQDLQDPARPGAAA